MARLVYIDETGSSGKGAKQQECVRLVAVIVDEDKVNPLRDALAKVEDTHFDLHGVTPREFHGVEIWNAAGPWRGKKPDELLAAYGDAISILDELGIDVAHAQVHKERLNARWGEDGDKAAYLLALQFLLEKIDSLGGGRERYIVVADEAKEHELRAVEMVADLQTWGRGEVSGKVLKNVIDSIHFVDSKRSPGVQMADLVAYLLQRNDCGEEHHPNAQEKRTAMVDAVWARTVTWRETWPRKH